MENFFDQYPYALFFIACFFLLIENRSNKKNINTNIIILYIIFSISSIFTVGSYWKNCISILVLSFVELEILAASEEKDMLVVAARFKLYDYIFTMINKYKVISMIGISFLFYLSKYFSNNMVIWFMYVLMISCLFLKNIGRIYENKFNVVPLEMIYNKYDKATKEYLFPTEYESKKQKELKKKIDMLLDVEDKTFVHRESSNTIICWESLVYKIDKDYNKVGKIQMVKYYSRLYRIKFFLININKIIRLSYKIVVLIVKALFSKEGFKKYLNRGYSTIEMQLIRTYGIDSGYEYSYIRKIYELIYANIFFKSYKRKCKYYHWYKYNDSEYNKYKIPYAYLKSVPTYVNRKRFNNIVEYYKFIKEKNKINELDKDNILYKLTLEETFIFILGLSMKSIDTNILSRYDDFIEKYGIDKRKLAKLIDFIENETSFGV